MNKMLAGLVLAGALIEAGPGAAQAPAQSGISVCLPRQVDHVTLAPLVGHLETAIIVADEAGAPLIKAGVRYGEPGADQYLTSGLPGLVTLPAGCSTIFVAMRPRTPDNSAPWACVKSILATGPVNSAGVMSTVVNATLGGGMFLATIVIPSPPSAGPKQLGACPL